MPEFTPIPDGARIVVVQTIDNQHISNNLWATKPGFDDAALAGLGNVVNDSWQTNVRPLLSDTLRLDGVIVVDWRTTGGAAYQIVGDNTTPVGVAGDVFPNSVALAVKEITAQRGKSFHGRIYLTGIPGTANDGPNRVTAAFADSLVAAMDQVMADMAAAGWTLVVASQFGGGVRRTVGLATPVTAFTYTDLVFDNQRRRLPGRGT